MVPHNHCHFATESIAMLSVMYVCSFFQRPNQFNGSSADLAQMLYHWILHYKYANIEIAAFKHIHYTTSARQSLLSSTYIT
jgi:hypothetical protein